MTNVYTLIVTPALSALKQNVSTFFYTQYNIDDIILFGKGEKVYYDIFYKILFAMFDLTNFYKIYEIMGSVPAEDLFRD